jgi:hypothetical protein
LPPLVVVVDERVVDDGVDERVVERLADELVEPPDVDCSADELCE